MRIKTIFKPMIAFLELNRKKKVEEILESIYRIAEAKKRPESTCIRNDDGEPVALKCYYFKRWMPLIGPKAVAFGKNKATKIGYTNMCKEGLSHWNKQLNKSKALSWSMLEKIRNKTINSSEIKIAEEEIEKVRNYVEPTTKGFITKEDVEEYLNNIK